MAHSLISRHGRGLILPNTNEVSERNAEEGDVMKDLLDGEEIQSDDNREDNRERSTQRVTAGDEADLISKDSEEMTGEDGNEKWYAFLEDLYDKFSEYSIQKDRQRYNVSNLEDWGQPGKPQGISVTPETFEKFLNKIGPYNVKEYETVKNLKTATASQIEELNQILSLTLKHVPTVSCSEPNIVVRDNLVSIDEAMQHLNSNSDTQNGCSNFRSLLESGKYNQFQFFALTKLFIDADLQFGRQNMSVAFISPTWEVVGTRNIDLSAADGLPHEKQKAKNGASPGDAGIDGAPGNPGYTGESFFGIGTTFVGGKNLKITSNGGRGGPGQDGGDGAKAAAGPDAPTPAQYDNICRDDNFKGFECRKLDVREVPYSGTIVTFRIFGKPSSPGGKGGDGGKEGRGGDVGKMALLELSRASEIQNPSVKGKEGEIGRAGAGGPGVKNGDDLIADFEMIKTLIGVQYRRWANINRVSTGVSAAGSKGIDGGNSVGRRDPVPATGISRPPDLVTDYKIYLRENLNSPIQNRTLSEFLNQVEGDTNVRKLYDVLALVDEFRGLEEQVPKLRKLQIKIHPFYSSLAERIKAFAESQKDASKDSKKVLNYLYTATMGRIDNLRDSSQQVLVIDMRKYLNMIADNIKTLKDVQSINVKADVVDKYKNDYKSSVDAKIKDAQALIDSQVSPEIDKINAEIEGEIKKLIDETIAMQKAAKIDKEKLEKKKREMESAMLLKGFINYYKFIGSAVSSLGPYGQVASAAIEVGTSVVEAFALNDQAGAFNLPSNIASTLTTLRGQLQAMRDKKVTYVNKLIDGLSNEIKKNPEKLKDMEKKVELVKERLKKITSKEANFNEIKILENELENDIRKKGLDLKKDSGDKKSMDALASLEKVTNIIKFGSMFTKFYSEMKSDQQKINTLADAIDTMSDKIKLLQEYEKNIYNTIEPMLHQMEDNMKDISAKLGTKSHVELDVTKWQVQSTLKGMQLQMQKLTEGHAVRGDITRSIEKLDEVMTTLITVYDRIQTYQYQKNLAAYIGDICSPAATSINIRDQRLVKAVNRLEFAIRANIVIGQYKSAIDGLKQWVFPFSDRYIEKAMMPSELERETDVETLVQSATMEIERIKQKIDLYDASITKGDEYLECEEFSSRYVSSTPFYVWKDEDSRMSISSLLSGKKVLFRADVEQSPYLKDAIKFSEIDFDLKTKDESAQSMLFNTLKGFDVRATHLGNSYYRYANQISLITSSSITISYSYEKNDNGMPIRSNDVYRRLASGDLLLSPYALWEIKLINQTDKYSFKDLEKYQNDTNLELAGLGNYVNSRVDQFVSNKSSMPRNNDILPFFKPQRTGLNDCGRSKHRSTRSVEGFSVSDDFVTNHASKGLSSPINLFCNFLKTYFVSNLVLSINRVFFREPTRNDCSQFPVECSEMNPTVEISPITKNMKVISVEENDTKERHGPDLVFDVNMNDSCFKPFLLSDQEERNSNYPTQVPDFNCSLLLADLITRTVTRNTYRAPLDLLSPREVMLRKMRDGVFRKESEFKRMLHLHRSEKEHPISWISKLNGYAKSILQSFGGCEVTEEYVQDIRHLYD